MKIFSQSKPFERARAAAKSGGSGSVEFVLSSVRLLCMCGVFMVSNVRASHMRRSLIVTGKCMPHSTRIPLVESWAAANVCMHEQAKRRRLRYGNIKCLQMRSKPKTMKTADVRKIPLLSARSLGARRGTATTTSGTLNARCTL